MSEPATDCSFLSIEIELREALAEHAATYPHGDWKAANDRIGRVRRIADSVLHAADRWPVSKIAISNDECLALLRDAGNSQMEET